MICEKTNMIQCLNEIQSAQPIQSIEASESFESIQSNEPKLRDSQSSNEEPQIDYVNRLNQLVHSRHLDQLSNTLDECSYN